VSWTNNRAVTGFLQTSPVLQAPHNMQTDGMGIWLTLSENYEHP